MSELASSANVAEKGAIAIVAMIFWDWYARHAPDVIFSRRVVKLFSVTIRVSDLRPLFVRLFGEPTS